MRDAGIDVEGVYYPHRLVGFSNDVIDVVREVFPNLDKPVNGAWGWSVIPIEKGPVYTYQSPAIERRSFNKPRKRSRALVALALGIFLALALALALVHLGSSHGSSSGSAMVTIAPATPRFYITVSYTANYSQINGASASDTALITYSGPGTITIYNVTIDIYCQDYTVYLKYNGPVNLVGDGTTTVGLVGTYTGVFDNSACTYSTATMSTSMGTANCQNQGDTVQYLTCTLGS